MLEETDKNPLHAEREALAANFAAEREGQKWRPRQSTHPGASFASWCAAVVVLGLPFTAGYWVGRRRNGGGAQLMHQFRT